MRFCFLAGLCYEVYLKNAESRTVVQSSRTHSSFREAFVKIVVLYKQTDEQKKKQTNKLDLVLFVCVRNIACMQSYLMYGRCYHNKLVFAQSIFSQCK